MERRPFQSRATTHRPPAVLRFFRERTDPAPRCAGSRVSGFVLTNPKSREVVLANPGFKTHVPALLSSSPSRLALRSLGRGVVFVTGFQGLYLQTLTYKR